MIPYGKQEIVQSDIDAVLEALTSDFLTQGPRVPAFEKSLTDYTGAEYALALNSATSALHAACLALDLGVGDWLWTSPITFVASANCGLYCGANVDFVDIDPRTYNICPKALKEKLKIAEKEGKLPKILVPVHLCGQSCDMQAIYHLAQHYGVKIIEDASHAIGGRHQEVPVGKCKYSDVTVFSFHPVKIITTGEGGAALTNDFDLANKIALYRSHGITRDETCMTERSHGGWYYQQVELGYNYRMTELQAALGISQMRRLEKFVEVRNKIASFYNESLKDLPIVLPFQHADSYSSFHLYVIRIELGRTKFTHKYIYDKLRQDGVGVSLHYIPVHIQPYYKGMGFREGDFPKSESYYREALSLPIHHMLSEEDQSAVVEKLKNILK